MTGRTQSEFGVLRETLDKAWTAFERGGKGHEHKIVFCPWCVVCGAQIFTRRTRTGDGGTQ